MTEQPAEPEAPWATTAEELDALPVGTVGRTSSGNRYTRTVDGWVRQGAESAGFFTSAIMTIVGGVQVVTRPAPPADPYAYSPEPGHGPMVIRGDELRSAALVLIIQPDRRARWVSRAPLDQVADTLIDVAATVARQRAAAEEASDGA